MTKLVQKGTVVEYQEEFEQLSNKVDGLFEKFLLSCFVSSLKPHIQYDVASFQPTTLTKAMALAKIKEQKLSFKHNPPKLFSPYPPLLPTPLTNQTNSSSTYVKPTHTTTTSMPISNRLPSHNSNSQPKTMIQKLSQSQIQAKKEKGLCFYCDDKYTIGHKCKASAHVIIIPNSKVLNLEEDVENDNLYSPEESSELVGMLHNLFPPCSTSLCSTI